MQNREHLAAIPEVLKQRPHWVGFHVADGKKTPVIAGRPSKRAKSNAPETWRTYSEAVGGLERGEYDAIAYALNEDFIGVDMDHCVDPAGNLNQKVAEIVKRCASYAERSISGTGVHVLLKGTLPDGKGRKVNGIELYCRARFFICTGNRLPDAPVSISENPEAITWLLGESVTETTEAICSVVSAFSVVSVTVSPEDVVQTTLPKRPGERNARLLDLARGLRFNAGMAKVSLGKVKPHVRDWHKKALPVIRTKPFEDTWADFVHAWPHVRVPLGQDVLSIAWENSRTHSPPAVAADYETASVRRLVCLCAELARMSPQGRFFLSSHAAGRLLGEHPMQVNRWLTMLIADGVLRKTHAGNEHRATRFRWIGATNLGANEAP